MKSFERITIENTTYCQANCIMCVRDQIRYPLSHMTQELFEKTVSQTASFYEKMGGKLKYMDLGGMGESLVDPSLEEKLEWLKEAYPDIRVYVTSNGQLLYAKSELLCKYVDVLKISNYGFSKRSFESIHRGALVYEQVKESIEAFLALPDRPSVMMSFIMMPENEGEEWQWKEYWENKCEEISIWKPHNWAGYKGENADRNDELCRSCGRPGKDFTVRANGDVSVCCWDFNRDMSLGNLNEQSFEEIYNGEKLRKIVEMHKNKSFWECDNLCAHCDQIYDRSDALIYSSDPAYKTGEPLTREIKK